MLTRVNIVLVSDTKSQMLHGARDLLREEGLGGFSMRKVAKRAGVSATAIYRHYEDRDALLAAAVLQGFRLFTSYLNDSLRAGTPLLRLQASYQRYLDFADEQQEHYVLMFKTPRNIVDHCIFDEAARGEMSATFAFLVARIEECQQDGSLPQKDPMQAAVHAWASMHGLAALFIDHQLPPAGVSRQQLADQHFEAILAALRQPSAGLEATS